MTKTLRPICLLICLSALCAGCAGQIATHEEAVESVRAGEMRERLEGNQWSAKSNQGEVDDGWLKSFNDPTLLSLVQEAEQNNFELQIAAAKIDQAMALTNKAGASLKPSVDLAGGYADRNFDDFGEVFGGGLTISWEADVWGRIRSGVAGAEETAAATVSDYAYARQSLAAATANSWFLANSSKLLFDYANEIDALFSESLRIVTIKERIGQVDQQDIHLAKANLAKAKEAARQAEASLEDSKRSLEILLGRYPGAEIQANGKLPAVPPPISAGIPSELLERRPDLIAAEQRVAAAFYKQKEAELVKLPRFSFSLTLGLTNLRDAISSLAAGIFAPLYKGGAIEADIAAATAVQKQAIAAYGHAALQAFKEVESALSQEEHLGQREKYLQITVDENFKAYQLVQKQYEIGKIDFLDVLNVQNKWVQAKIALINISTLRLLNRVQLHLALGGSFE
ncbi:TolC family protein [Desulfogranum japonicum]|uniref:TolC family protein n=1 Tax=Desulfogranum japonicum TaxID=231447 RepID=UPI0004141539|nr:TolC family protein [Desulfogranum japonicum]